MDMNFKAAAASNLSPEPDIEKTESIGSRVSEDYVDFALLMSSLPKGLISEKALNKRTKNLINSLAFVYDLDTLKMCELLRLVVNENGVIDKDSLRLNARKYYQFNNSGSLPTLIYRTQPEHLKTPEGDMSNRGKMLYIFLEEQVPWHRTRAARLKATRILGRRLRTQAECHKRSHRLCLEEQRQQTDTGLHRDHRRTVEEIEHQDGR